jgi:acetyl esterase
MEDPMSTPVLEPAAQKFADAAAQPPLLYERGVDGARALLDEVQAAPIDKPDVDETWITVVADVGDVQVRVLKPLGAHGILPVILYVHGGGWILGNSGTHDRLVRELCAGAGAAVVFVEYDRSPEVRYPVAIEQAYATARWICGDGRELGLDPSRIAVVGDSVGGNMAAVLAILAKERGDVTFVHQSLYYPVTDAGQDTDSYREFADGPHLTAKAMAWFWDAYEPDVAKRDAITLSPLRAGVDDLAGLPDAFVIVDENDVLRDEGEAYARKLTQAGVRTVSARYNGAHHDFLMLNPVRGTAATTAALEQAVHVLRRALRVDGPSRLGPPNPSSPPRILLHQTESSTTMLTDKPTIALVHGAFAESSSWDPVIECLYHHDTPLIATHPQSFRDVVAIANPLRSLAGDATYVRDVLSSIGGPIVLVGHSYGGMVITEAAADNDDVVGLVYVAAFAPDQGESAFQLSTMYPGSTLGDALFAYPVSSGGNEFVIKPELFHHQFCADVPGQRARLMAATQRPVTMAALSDGVTTNRPAWKDLPSWFVYGDEDLNIPAELQRFLVERAGARGSRELSGASHAISVSRPEAVAESILDAVRALTPVTSTS